MKYTEAQKNADKKWRENNKEHASYLRSRSSARSFIRNKATSEDLKELEELIKNRKEELLNNAN
ncbi:MAG: hypothetical protein ACI4P7_04370 [Bacilli bacterium]